MSQPIESILQSALNGLSLRQQITSDNIANSDTPGFKAREVRFEDQLNRALQGVPTWTTFQQATAPSVDVAPGAGNVNGNSVDLDQQLLGMTETTQRYNAVAGALSQRLALYQAIVSDTSP